MMMMVRLVMLVTMVSCSPYLLVLDQTRCYTGDPDPEPVVGADQVVKAVNWTLERMNSFGNFQESGTSSMIALNTMTNHSYFQ